MTKTAQKIKILRHQTGAGILDCKNALSQSKGDLEKAVEYLRKKGLAGIAKRAYRATNEGAATVKMSSDGKIAVMVALNCETDFVAKTGEFKKLLSDITDYAFKNPNNTGFDRDEKIKQMISDTAPKLGENITLKGVVIYKLKGSGALNHYLHSDNKNCALVEILCDDKIAGETQKLKDIAKELALQIVAMKPRWIKPEDVSQTVIDKEKEIYREHAKTSGKPEKAVEKMLEGKLRKFFEHTCLLEQESIRESKTKIKDYLKKQADTLGGSIVVSRFERF
jgi:elongation factor Ts